METHSWIADSEYESTAEKSRHFLHYQLSPLLFLNASPEQTTRWTTENANNTKYLKWASETGHRLQVASYSLLMIGSVALVLAIFLILFEERWVANIVSKFENHGKQENDDNEELAAAEAKIETNYAGFSDPNVEMEYIAVDQVLFDSKLFKT